MNRDIQVNNRIIKACGQEIVGNYNIIIGDLNRIWGIHNVVIGSFNVLVGNNAALGSENIGDVIGNSTEPFEILPVTRGYRDLDFAYWDPEHISSTDMLPNVDMGVLHRENRILIQHPANMYKVIHTNDREIHRVDGKYPITIQNRGVIDNDDKKLFSLTCDRLVVIGGKIYDPQYNLLYDTCYSPLEYDIEQRGEKRLIKREDDEDESPSKRSRPGIV